ncbi:MAG: phosphate regulon sensor histidine kinase PhoR [Gammaproteobacteria bacterium]|nr:phosphate regulon sensor histidine kinase PhoR [Gammaproteobacteria bacterium]
MNPRRGWIQEFWRIILLLSVAVAAGALVDQVVPFLLLALLAYTLRNLYNLQRLADWLGERDVNAVPNHFGIWGDIYSRIALVSARQAQREKRLNELVNEYSASTAALPDATVALDANGRIRWFNDAASRLLGLKTAKDIGQPLINLFRNPQTIEFIRSADYSRTVQTAAPGNADSRLEMRLAPYGDGQVLLLAQDITERVRLERVRRDFVANVSHELRTPLTVLSGFVENLQAMPDLDDPRLQRPLEIMAQQSARMRRIVEDLLLLARLESESTRNAPVPVDVGELLHQVADECQALRTEVAEIRCEVLSSRRVLGDATQLRSAITNLAVNAVNHTPASGRVTLRWSDRGVESVLEVSDTGEGIAAEHLPRLTERFYRVDAGRSRERGGTGLGLAIVKHVLKRHDARLAIHSRLGEGSHFTCVFPASRLAD